MRRSRTWMMMLRSPKKLQPGQMFFCAAVLAGAFLGYFAGALVPDAQHGELADYLLGYSRSASSRPSAPFSGLLFAYFRLPVALCLLGFAAFGVWVIPSLVAAHGFLLSFSIRCFCEALGRSGALLALPAMGLRCLFVFPCVFYLSCRCWKDSLRRRKGSSLREKSDRPALYPLLICGVVLLIGCILDAAISPRLISLILDRIS